MEVCTVKQFAESNREKGLWPDSEASIWAIRNEQDNNGFAKAFKKMGRRVLIDIPVFWECFKKMQGGKNESLPK